MTPYTRAYVLCAASAALIGASCYMLFGLATLYAIGLLTLYLLVDMAFEIVKPSN